MEKDTTRNVSTAWISHFREFRLAAVLNNGNVVWEFSVSFLFVDCPNDDGGKAPQAERGY